MRELKVTPIRNGTVIDHLPAGSALAVCKVLGIPRPGSASTVSVVINVPSRAHGRKDIVKVEDRELGSEDLGRLAVLAPHATVNVVRDYHVAQKVAPRTPEVVTALFVCPNQQCITNDHEPVLPEFRVLRGNNGDVTLQCVYCSARVHDPLQHVR